MTQDALHGLGLDLRLVHKPIRKRVSEIVEPESLAVRNLQSSGLGCWPEMVGNEDSGGDRHPCGAQKLIGDLQDSEIAMFLPGLTRARKLAFFVRDLGIHPVESRGHAVRETSHCGWPCCRR